jgi:hypothetical protein
MGLENRLHNHAAKLAGQLEALKGQLSRLVREYPKRDTLGKIAMVTAILRNQHRFLDELLITSILSRNETAEEQAAVIEVKADMRKVVEVVTQGSDETVLDHLFTMIVRTEDLGIIKSPAHVGSGASA